MTLGGSLSSLKPSHSRPTCFSCLCLCPSEYLPYFPLQWHIAMRNTRLHHGTLSLSDQNEGRQMQYITPPPPQISCHLLIACASFCFECHHLMCQHELSSHTLRKGFARLWSHLHSNLFVLCHISHGLIQKVWRGEIISSIIRRALLHHSQTATVTHFLSPICWS